MSIGILTYRRPDGLTRCLASVRARLEHPLSPPWVLAEILVIDNDAGGSARPVVSVGDTATAPGRPTDAGPGSAPRRPIPVRYLVEPEPGIAAARSRALAEAAGDVLVFIDDDEVAGDGWPHGLLASMHETGAALVGGPVLSSFVETPPKWIIDGRFFDRDDPTHGSRQEWLRSGNLAIDLTQVRAVGIDFDRRYPQGEDSAFTRRAGAAGLDLRWSSEGAVTEIVSAERFDVGWRLQRDYLSHRAWSRSSLDLAGGRLGRLAVRGRILVAAFGRTGTGLARLLQAIPRIDKATAVRGMLDLVGAAAKMVELVAYRRPR